MEKNVKKLVISATFLAAIGAGAYYLQKVNKERKGMQNQNVSLDSNNDMFSLDEDVISFEEAGNSLNDANSKAKEAVLSRGYHKMFHSVKR